MINNVTLVGRLTADPNIRYTASGNATSTFSIAVNRQFKNQAGEREADFIRCVIWRQAAENFANWAKKGALIGVTGRIQTGNYENNQGQRVYTTDVVVENFQMLESRSQSESQQAPQQNNSYQQSKPQQQSNNFGTAPIEIDDMDELPF